MKRILLITLCLCAFSMHSQQWEISHEMDEGVILVGGDCNGEGNFIFGAYNGNAGSGYLDAFAMFVNDEGEFVERKFCFEGYKSYLCNAVCMDNGNAFVVGVKGGTLTNRVYDTLWIAVMNPELEIVEERNYPIEAPYITWTTDVYLELNNYGEIIVLTDVSERCYPNVTNGVYAVFKCDTHGNILKNKYFAEGHGVNGARPTGIVKVPNSDNMMILGRGFFVSNCHSICYIDNDLNKIEAYPLPWLEDNRNYTDCWKDNGHFLMSSMTHYYGVADNSYYAAVFEVDGEGHYVDTLVYDRADTSDYTAQFGSMAYAGDGAIYIATYWERGFDEMPTDAVICLIDNDLNLLGTKRLMINDTKIRIMHCQRTSDGGCLVYGQCKKNYGSEMVQVWKLLPGDFVIPWNLDDNLAVLQHQTAYPNPTEDYLNIVLQDVDNQTCKVAISDIFCRKCFERKFGHSVGLLSLDVSSLEHGMYFYEVHVGKHSVHKGKFFKK